VGYAFRGKQWLEWGNPNAVGMSGLIGWGGAYQAMHDCDLCLLLGTDFPFPDFYPANVDKVQVDLRPSKLGRRTHLDMALVGDVRDTVSALLPLVAQKEDTEHLDKALKTTEKWRERLHGYVTRGDKVSPIRPEFLISTVDELADDDAAITADTGTPCIWVARHVTAKQGRHIFGSFSWASMANAMPNAMGIALAYPGRQVIAVCGDGGLSMLIGDLLTITARNLPVKLVVLNNRGLQFVYIEQEESGIEPFGIELADPNFAKLAEAFGITGIRVEDPGDVRTGVERLLSTPGPALLDAVVSPHALSLPPHTSFGIVEGFSLSLAKQALHGDLDDAIGTVKERVSLT
jgi:pyruvate dehydrogenase (quinone)